MTKKNTKKNTVAKKARKDINLKKELQDTKDKYLRLYSEFENYRRRTSKEKIEMIDLANKDLLSDILPVIDDFERAIKSIEKETTGFFSNLLPLEILKYITYRIDMLFIRLIPKKFHYLTYGAAIK